MGISNFIEPPVPMGGLYSDAATMPLFALDKTMFSGDQEFFNRLPEEKQQQILHGCHSQEEFHQRVQKAMKQQ